MLLKDRIQEATAFIKKLSPSIPEIGLILGSGLGSLTADFEDAKAIEYEAIPHFPLATAPGHNGRLVFGNLEGKKVVAMEGRFHYYEGYSMAQVTFPLYVFHALGCKALLVTNACGALNSSFQPGDLMLIKDQINILPNPLIGPNDDELGPRFSDMSQAYNYEFRQLAKIIAREQEIDVKEGVYLAISGPSYSTPAELRMLIAYGSDTVGMSTVPEVIVANYLGLKVLGIACITDMALPDSLEPLTEQEVIDVANQTRPKLQKLVRGWLRQVDI